MDIVNNHLQQVSKAKTNIRIFLEIFQKKIVEEFRVDADSITISDFYVDIHLAHARVGTRVHYKYNVTTCTK